MAPSSHDSPRLGVLLALILMVFGGLLRGWAVTGGFISDEICWLSEGGVYGNWASGETAVNPPALRMVLAAITTDHWQVIHLGRGWSVVAGTAAIPLMFWLGRLVGQNKNIPGFLAAFYLALLPLAIQEAGWYRSYATLLFVLIWHLIALVKVVDAGKEPPERSWVVHLVVSTALLPQVHYVGVAVVFLEGLSFALWLRDRRFIRYYLPSALLFAPLGYRIITGSSEHMAPYPDRMRNLTDLFEVVVHHPVLTVLTVLCWVRLQGRQRILLLAAISSSVGLIAVSCYHNARLELGIVPAAYLIPLMATLPLVVPVSTKAWRWARGLAWVALAGAFLHVLEDRVMWWALNPRAQDGPPLLAQDVEAGSWPDDRPTYLLPLHTTLAVYFYLEHRRLLTPCPVDERMICFEYGERIFMGFDNRDLPPSNVVVFSAESEEERFGAQCSLARSQPTYWVWDCANGWKAP